jgi:hypothetical protein
VIESKPQWVSFLCTLILGCIGGMLATYAQWPLPWMATEKVMGVLDAINGRWGRGTMRLASVPTDPDWGMRREMMSQSVTTRVDQLWTVYCR